MRVYSFSMYLYVHTQLCIFMCERLHMYVCCIQTHIHVQYAFFFVCMCIYMDACIHTYIHIIYIYIYIYIRQYICVLSVPVSQPSFHQMMGRLRAKFAAFAANLSHPLFRRLRVKFAAFAANLSHPLFRRLRVQFTAFAANLSNPFFPSDDGKIAREVCCFRGKFV